MSFGGLMQNCRQCGTVTTRVMATCGNPICEGCETAARRQLEGALGGSLTAEQIYRMFDMGGAGVVTGCQPQVVINWGKI